MDNVLAEGGAPPDHPVWDELRRVRLLPADAVRVVVALRPADLDGSAIAMRATARSCAEVAESLPAPGEWSGAASEEYDQARRVVAERLTASPESLDERLDASADLADSMARWMRSARDSVAGALADVLLSTQAMDLEEPVSRATGAAADVAAHILQAVADAYDRAAELSQRSSGLAEPLTITG
ncbi:hypothetical protein [Actinoplanes sp. NPDC051494]|uniref:hypothetical protein n=1 Tax=Actinoplanes sp. NPDC051494 TaxID=3363907 RepID=UPI0037912252